VNRRAFAAATVAVAALGGTLSTTVDTSAVAAAGKSVILGEGNRSKGTTTLVSKGKGPALRLRSRGQVPSLAVSNSQLVKQFNADLLDGHDAADLAPVTTRFVLGRPGDRLQPRTLGRVELPAGSYAMTGSGALEAVSGPTSWQCAAATAESVTGLDEIKLLALDIGTDIGGPHLSEVVTTDGRPLAVGCFVESEHHVLTTLSFTFRRVNGVVTGQVDPLPVGRDDQEQLRVPGRR
jgi:hypothetical protein